MTISKYLPIAAIIFAIAILEGEAKETGDSSSNHNNKGVELAQERKYEDAVKEFNLAIQANPKNAKAYINRGSIFRAMHAQDQQYDDAIKDFTKAIEIAPKDPQGYLERGQTLVMQKQYDQALVDLNKAAELKPDDVAAVRLQGFAEIGLGDLKNPNDEHWNKAAADFTTAIQKDPNDAQAYERLGFIHRSQKKFNEAIADYDKSLQIKPDPDVYTKRGYTYVTYLQNYEKGIADYEQALKINPNDYDTQQRLQYAQQALKAKNAPPPTATPTPTPEPGLFTPMNIGIGLAVLLVLIGIIFVVTRRRGGGDEDSAASSRIR